MAEKIDINQQGQVSSKLVPRNLSESGSLGYGIHIKGGHDYPYLKAPASDPTKWDDVTGGPVVDGSGAPVDPDYLPPYRTQPGLLDMHPARMVENMSATVKIGFERVEVTLIRNPSFINYGEITESNWNLYWHVKNRFVPENAQILEFAKEYDGTISGYPDPGRPPYDNITGTYPAEAESLWETVQDTKIHRWYRIKFVDFDENDNPIVGKISPPIPIGENSTTFVREVNLYIRSGDKATLTPSEAKPERPASFLADGSPNNFPVGYSDEPVATDTDQYLWVIRALRKLTGDIDTVIGWSMPALVPEDANLTRYSATGKPDPNGIVATTQTIDASLEADLQNAGWVTALEYDELIHFYIATRVDNGDTTYSEWRVEQVRQEDGTILKRRFKLLPLISDYDDPTWVTNNKPSGWDPSDDGWIDELGGETPFLVNFYSEATFYADQSIKRDWSAPKPFTSVDTYSDDISIHPNDAGSIDAAKQIDDTIIKRFVGGVETHDPENLWLRANLLKGDNDLAIDANYTLTYQWYKIFNDGEFLPSPTDLGTNRDIQVSNTDVTGRAIFKCEITLDGDEVQDAIADGSISSLPVFVEQISITDQVDGRDGRTLSISSTQSRFIKTGASAPFTYLPSSIIIRAEGDNVDTSNVKWYYLNGSDPINDTWVEITATTNTSGSSPKHTYKDSANNLVLVGGVDTTATDIFEVLSQEEAIFKAEIPASGSLPKLEDWTMISRITQSDLAAGESAYDVHVEGLFHQIRIDETGTPLAGEFAAIESFIEARKGNTLLANGDYSVSVASVSGALSVTGDVVVANEGANQKKITFVASPTWDITKRDALITLNVTYGTETKTQYIGLGTSFEPSGFTGLNISSNRSTFTFDYSDGGRDDIVLTALLTKHTDEGNTELTGWLYEWKVKSGRFQSVGVGGIITGADVTGNQLTVSPGDLDGSAEYECYAYQSKSGSDYVPPFYVDSVRINDQPDNTVRTAYHANDHDTIPSLIGLTWDAIKNGSSYNGWHKDYDEVNDKWQTISYNGGTVWDGPFKINPQDGESIKGDPGEDATLKQYHFFQANGVSKTIVRIAEITFPNEGDAVQMVLTIGGPQSKGAFFYFSAERIDSFSSFISSNYLIIQNEIFAPEIPEINLFYDFDNNVDSHGKINIYLESNDSTYNIFGSVFRMNSKNATVIFFEDNNDLYYAQFTAQRAVTKTIEKTEYFSNTGSASMTLENTQGRTILIEVFMYVDVTTFNVLGDLATGNAGFNITADSENKQTVIPFSIEEFSHHNVDFSTKMILEDVSSDPLNISISTLENGEITVSPLQIIISAKSIN